MSSTSKAQEVCTLTTSALISTEPPHPTETDHSTAKMSFTSARTETMPYAEHSHSLTSLKYNSMTSAVISQSQRPTAAYPSSAFGRHATQSIAPFLAEHIPEQYAPQGLQAQTMSKPGLSNTRFCYRHRPDLKCRRQADEPSMGQLQNELATLSQSDQQAISHVWSLFSAAPAKHRNLMLQGVLAQCCFPQLSYISASVRDLIKIDFLTALPAELGLKILSHLDPTSICKAAQVSERWRSLADDDVVWHRMCEQHIDRKCTSCGWGLPLLDRKRLRTEKRQIQLRATGRQHDGEDGSVSQEAVARNLTPPHEDGLCETSAIHTHEAMSSNKRPFSEDSCSAEASSGKRLCSSFPREEHGGSQFQTRLQPWKMVYRDRFRIGTNWKYGRCSVKTFKGHTNGVMCVQFDERVLASGSYDSTVKLWDIETGDEIRTFVGHELGVRCLQFDDSLLVSGSLDGTIKMWDVNSGKLLRTLSGHGGGVIALHFDGKTIASGSQDNTISVWNFSDKSRSVLRGHTDWVNSVRIDRASRTLFSASDDCTVRLWDLDTKRCIRVFEGHVGQVQQVIPLPAEFDAGDAAEDSHASWEATSLFEPEGPDRPTPPRYMLTASLDATMRLWDVRSGRCVRTFFGHVEGIWGLAADTLRVVSGANDRMVKVWDPRTGKCERTFTGHAGPVTCVGLSDRRMATGSEDHEVRLHCFGE